MSFLKYHKEQVDADGERLWWPGGPDGFPFRGPIPPNVTETEYQDLQPSSKFRCRLFYLSDEKDYKDYIIIRDKCANGLYIPIDKDRVWDDSIKNYRVYLEWVEPAYEALPQSGGKDAIHETIKESSVLMPYGKLSGARDKTGW